MEKTPFFWVLVVSLSNSCRYYCTNNAMPAMAVSSTWQMFERNGFDTYLYRATVTLSCSRQAGYWNFQCRWMPVSGISI